MPRAMRQATRHKYYGRTQTVQSLKELVTEVLEIERLSHQTYEHPLASRLRAVSLGLEAAAKNAEHFKFGGKPFTNRLKKVQADVQALLKEATEIPVFAEEKAIVKHDKETGMNEQVLKHSLYCSCGYHAYNARDMTRHLYRWKKVGTPHKRVATIQAEVVGTQKRPDMVL